jgi:hypothetical protein
MNDTNEYFSGQLKTLLLADFQVCKTLVRQNKELNNSTLHIK